ncbi:MAG TPA: TetR/AcrR family transcriptional regulator [Pseudonocardiaceae bacterium]|nr:TetR/AcrR family transcriptional regulator [Pseudonocardiaceae bacterium]
MSVSARTYRGVSAEERKAERREKLLAAGLEVLGTLGWERTTMTAVCAEARLTERYFYESFSGREELLVAVADQVAVEARAAVLAALRAAPAQPRAAAREAIAAFVGLFEADPRKGRVAILESAAAPPMRRRRQELLREFTRLIVDEGHALFGAAALPPPWDEINALLFAGGLAELVAAWLTGEIDATTEQIIDAAADQFAATAHR